MVENFLSDFDFGKAIRGESLTVAVSNKERNLFGDVFVFTGGQLVSFADKISSHVQDRMIAAMKGYFKEG